MTYDGHRLAYYIVEIIDTDCIIVKAVQDRQPDRSRLIIAEIKRFSSVDSVCKFVKVDRSQVRVSHCIVNFAKTER